MNRIREVKLKISKELLMLGLGNYIVSIEHSELKPALKLVINGQVMVYIRYNNHQQYSYSIIFSKFVLDRIRFDNYDENWDINSNPHHLHPRYQEDGVDSPMNGDPENDMPILIDVIIDLI